MTPLLVWNKPVKTYSYSRRCYRLHFWIQKKSHRFPTEAVKCFILKRGFRFFHSISLVFDLLLERGCNSRAPPPNPPLCPSVLLCSLYPYLSISFQTFQFQTFEHLGRRKSQKARTMLTIEHGKEMKKLMSMTK